MFSRKILIVAAMLFFSRKVRSLSYDEILHLGKVCPGDNCMHGGKESLIRTCQCDHDCSLFKDCCIDSHHSNEHRPYPVVCETFGQTSVFTISSCPSHFKDNKIRTLCHSNRINQRDPLLFTPVVDPRTKITYKNRFCAICNNRESNLLTWQTKLELKKSYSENYTTGVLTRDYIFKNVVFNERTSEWGLWLYSESNKWEFYGFSIIPTTLGEVDRTVRRCTPNLISKCSNRKATYDLRKKCEAYQGTIYFQTGYRNIHCAMCNNENTTANHHCVLSVPFGSGINFAVLLDFNFSDGNVVGQDGSSCKQGELYDPFSKRCREVVCGLPGYRMVNGKCESS